MNLVDAGQANDAGMLGGELQHPAAGAADYQRHRRSVAVEATALDLPKHGNILCRSHFSLLRIAVRAEPTGEFIDSLA
ncbi:hypothetical protein DIJ64_03800 [Mycobacterium leprae]|uniref:Uncharacterized protein n=1 Tax=Mycobacterium leprae TaxID=1769 RepID=A0AAD0P7G4_MYCLR|nr:hypothetical protein DIJ64_03800 [Mycobacterium leprae]OAR21724.1 hypothetical protein A8144_00490 [Mycobacterium leprae 3125609]